MASAFTEFQSLCNRRELAAHQLVGVAKIASAYLNLGEFQKAQNLLQGAVLDYELADDKISAFHEAQIQSKENSVHGNRTEPNAA